MTNTAVDRLRTRVLLNSFGIFRCEFDLPRMAGVFDIELHDGDAANQDESDDDVIETREVASRDC